MSIAKDQDIGVTLLYYFYAKHMTPDAILAIKHELVKVSPLMYYLTMKGMDIFQIASALYTEKEHGA